MKTLTAADKIVTASMKTLQVLKQAEEMFDIAGLSDRTNLTFDLRGHASGQARGRNLNRRLEGTFLQIRLNESLLMTEEGWEQIINDTIQHEVAHLVCFVRRELGEGHNEGWKAVCKALGGTGERLHSCKTYFGRGNTWEYTSLEGKKVFLSDKRHAYIQNNNTLLYRRYGTVNKTCPFVLVARSGKAISADAPVVEVKKAQVEAGKTKAAIIREWLLEAKTSNLPAETVVVRAIAELGMKRALALTYVKNNLSKV